MTLHNPIWLSALHVRGIPPSNSPIRNNPTYSLFSSQKPHFSCFVPPRGGACQHLNHSVDQYPCNQHQYSNKSGKQMGFSTWIRPWCIVVAQHSFEENREWEEGGTMFLDKWWCRLFLTLLLISDWYAIESDIDSANSLSDSDPPKKKRKQAEANSAQKSNGMFITYLFHSYN